jgi:nucleoside-diphosphate-sugar epimerase
MKIFMTGASGYVGSAILDLALASGHEIVALARSDRSAAALGAKGVTVACGSLADHAILERSAAAADAIIHTGFDHDFTRFRESCEQDQRAIAALGRGIAGSARTLIVTSAIGILPRGGFWDEGTVPATGPAASPRALTEQAADILRGAGSCVHVVRLPPSVHGAEDPNFVATLVRIARDRQVSAYPGAGDNHWPAVHRCDAARVFLACAENPPDLPVLHAVGEAGVRFEDIARAIGEGLGLPVASVDASTAADHFGAFTHFAAMDVRASADRTRRALAWDPLGPTLLEDIRAGLYF